MKKLLLLLLCVPLIGFGQQTYVPDDNFEQALINLGYDNVLDDYVLTASINTVTNLNVNSQNISDLTGIEDFTALTWLQCGGNQLTILDVSNNTALTYLNCSYNQLTSLDVSNNTDLTYLTCGDNQFTSLDVSQNTALTDLHCRTNHLTILDVSNNIDLITLDCNGNQLTILDVSGATALTELYCYNNQLTILDVSESTALTYLRCDDNQLTSLDLRNGNNMQMWFDCTNNPNLECINVDDVAWSTAFWTNTDPQHYFSNNCPPSAIEEHFTKKELLKVNDILGREVNAKRNTSLFYIYNDGTVEKRIVIE